MMKLCICATVLMLSMSPGYGQDGGMGGGMGGDPAPAPPAKQDACISGTVKLDGKAPKAKKIKEIGGDAYCSTQHTDAVYSEDVVVGEGNTLANVFVYVKKGAPKSDAPAAALFDQKGCVYTPHVLGLMSGQTVTITSSDDTAHNINVQAKLNKGFNESMASKGMKTDKVFALPELGIAVGCQVHPWMKAIIHVVDNKWFAVSGKDGKFTLPAGLPAGDYDLEAVHEKFGKMNGTVKVTDKGATWDFSFKGE